MNPKDAEYWKSQVLDEIFEALAASERLDGVLVFKGARVLKIRLGTGRQSLDLDSNLAALFVRNYPDREAQREFIQTEMTLAIRRHFEKQQPVQYELIAVSVKTSPPNSHPMGWDAFNVKINVEDLRKSIKALPALEIDVAAPEELLATSIATIEVGGHHVAAYTLERIAGEKLRAFLSSLPAYRTKTKRRAGAVRAKDLYDLCRISCVHALDDFRFWKLVGEEFRVACRSRYIDCQGLTTFQEQWDVTRKTYEQATIPKDIPFEQAEATLVAIVGFLERQEIIPFAFDLPDNPTK